MKKKITGAGIRLTIMIWLPLIIALSAFGVFYMYFR